MICGIIACVLLLAMQALVNKLVDNGVVKKWLRLFLMSWCLITIICAVNIYNLTEIKFETYLIIILFILFYLLGFVVISNTIPKRNQPLRLVNALSQLSVSKLYLSAFTFVSLITSYYFYKYLLYMSTAPLSDSRLARFYVGYVFNSGVEQILYNTVFSVIVSFFLITSSAIIVSGVRDKCLILLMTITVLSWSGFGFGRFDIVYVILLFLMNGSLLSGIVKIIKPKEKLNTSITKGFGILSSVFVMVLVSSYRTGAGQEDFDFISILMSGLNILFEQIVTYLNGSIIALQYALNESEKFGYPGYGMFTLSGFDEIISLLLNFLGFDVIPFNYSYSAILDKNIYIGEGFEFNALYTGIFYFYMDFGLIGVVVFSLILGMGSAFTVRNFIINQKIENLLLCWIFYSTSLLMPFMLKITSTDTALLFISALLYHFISSVFKKKV